MSVKPVFVVAAKRSGSTLMGLILGGHKDISWFHHFDSSVKFIGPDGAWPNGREFAQHLEGQPAQAIWDFQIDPNLDLRQNLTNMLQTRQEAEGKPVVGGTVHIKFSELVKIWPNARFCHLVRDPRDVALSVIAKGWRGNIWAASQDWLAAEQEWDKLCQMTPESNRLVIRYEDLAQNSEKTLREFAAFLGVEYSKTFFSYVENTPYDLPKPSGAFGWKQKLSLKEAHIVESALGNYLNKYGYERTGPKQTLSPFSIAYWKIADVYKGVLSKIKKYGFLLWISNYIIQKVAPHAWRQKSKSKILSIDRQEIFSLDDFVGDPLKRKAENLNQHSKRVI